MSNVPKHYPEKKRKSDCCEDSWIKFFVFWNSICIHNCLESPHELICWNFRGRG